MSDDLFDDPRNLAAAQRVAKHVGISLDEAKERLRTGHERAPMFAPYELEDIASGLRGIKR